MPNSAQANSTQMRTSLGRARGHGAGHGGTGHFIAQRVSAMALLILTPWFVVTASMTMRDAGYISAIDFLTQPANAVGVILLLVAALYHMSIGMQVIVEDYIHRPVTRALLLVANTLFCIALGAGAIFALLHINFAGA